MTSTFTARGRVLRPVGPGDALTDPVRLASIRRHRLLETPRDHILDRAGHLARRLLDTPVALVTVVTAEAYHLVGAAGLREPYAATRRAPLSHSYCHLVVRDDAPVAIENAHAAPGAPEAPATHELGIGAYLGVPLRDADGQVLGAFCVIDEAPRAWQPEDLRALEELSLFVRSELLLRDHLDQVERTMQARDDLVRTVAHDLRAAVTAVVGALQTLERHPELPATNREELSRIAIRQADRIDDMMEALLDPTRSAGFEPGSTTTEATVDSAVTAATAALGGRERIHLEVEEATFRTHAPSLERVLINLVRNALQHTTGAVEVTATRDPSRAAISFAVRDHGTGLPDWLLASDLGDASLRGRAAGHGIGLFSALALVRTLGGELLAETGTSGTRFTVSLPDLPATNVLPDGDAAGR